MNTFSVPTFLAMYLALCGGYLRNAQGGSVVLNSNAIKNLPGGGISHPSLSVSVSPRASPAVGGVGQAGATGTSSPSGCKADRQCGANEFCNESRGACLPCRKRRKRCGRDAMCCAGNRCINGVCQPAEMDVPPRVGADDGTKLGGNAKHGQNVTSEPKKKTPSQSHKTPKGGDGETCLRSSDCGEGLCCARHFWTRICKPVLTEGQVCTRHRRKGGQGLEIFQRCDCKPGLTCRVQKGARQHREEQQQQQQQQQQPRQHRDLHTCQRR
ncbi:dickkopf WNT signaling pathway inhibitor 1a [Alosa sapidissima]|uniref:dickkopf WNT signaling pathway inhibitor 1a n=1 Tax=Alosa sapidissima TaxID=34773 RepID=UPI001C09AF7A|nr:dickkopf WNT signaling pathway inhibitor 1a [Alosa sapidissima]XP_041921566.1 dickkopf WNT signaling pathway inhibitor 1a [Alosa sapidissima]